MRLNFHEYHDMTPIVIGVSRIPDRPRVGIPTGKLVGMLLAQGKILLGSWSCRRRARATMATARPRVNAIYFFLPSSTLMA
jgi:hypothetical protein